MNKNDYSAKIAVNKSLVKEYFSNNQRIVYLKDNQEFQIQFFNNNQFTIFASIEINGQLSSNKMICIRPGERIWLDRFLDNDDKMVFNTYEVNAKSHQVKKAIENNGLVKIYFYREQTRRPEIWNNYIWYDHNTSNPNYVPIVYYSTQSPISTTANTINTFFNYESNANYSSASLSSQPEYVSSSITALNGDGQQQFTSINTSFINTACNNDSINRENKTKSNINNDNITGRIEHGNHSMQKFDKINSEHEQYWFKCEEIKILPIDSKPVTSQDLKRRYCPECGRKINDKYKYCPFCGAKL